MNTRHVYWGQNFIHLLQLQWIQTRLICTLSVLLVILKMSYPQIGSLKWSHLGEDESRSQSQCWLHGHRWMSLFCMATATCRALKIARSRNEKILLWNVVHDLCMLYDSTFRGASKSFTHWYRKTNHPQTVLKTDLKSPLGVIKNNVHNSFTNHANICEHLISYYQNGLHSGHWHWKLVKLPKSSVLFFRHCTIKEPNVKHEETETVALHVCDFYTRLCSILSTRIEDRSAQAFGIQARSVRIEKSRCWEKAFLCFFTHHH